MASLMNLALVAGQLQTKYLNEIFVVGRGQYAELGPLMITVGDHQLRAAGRGDRAVRPAHCEDAEATE